MSEIVHYHSYIKQFVLHTDSYEQHPALRFLLMK